MNFTSTAYHQLASAIAEATQLPRETVLKALETPKNRAHGDIAFPCFLLAKQYKQPPTAAASALAESIALPEEIASVRATGPFLNFSINRAHAVRAILSSESTFAQESNATKTILVEYSSPNIAKPFHVGHLRATLIGNCIDRVYRYLGYATTSINHLGDWGTQFGFVWAGCSIWGKPEDASVSGLLDIYRKATALKSEQEERGVEETNQPDINEMARSYFLDLEAGQEYAKEFWKWCSDISLAYFKQTYARLDVSFDHYTGESFYSAMLPEVQQWLRDGGVLQESEKALGVDLEELGFARVATPDGRSLYLTRDIATARYRAKTFGFDAAIYVVGAPQTLHFQQLKEILRRMGEPYADAIIHVPFGHVLGIKTRGEGQFFELNAFLDEAQERALTAYREQVQKRPEGLDEHAVAKAVGLGAIIFGNLSRTTNKDVHFDWDSALSLQGDSGPYLLYAYARISGIKERALAAGVSIPSSAELKTLALSADGCSDAAFFLSEQIDAFLETLEQTRTQHEPAVLASYALELAKRIARAYLELKVVGVEPQLASLRLALFLRAQTVLGDCIELLGIPRLERM